MSHIKHFVQDCTTYHLQTAKGLQIEAHWKQNFVLSPNPH